MEIIQKPHKHRPSRNQNMKETTPAQINDDTSVSVIKSSNFTTLLILIADTIFSRTDIMCFDELGTFRKQKRSNLYNSFSIFLSFDKAYR